MIQDRTLALANRIFQNGDIKGDNPSSPFCATFLLATKDESTLDIDLTLNNNGGLSLTWRFHSHYMKLKPSFVFTDTINQKISIPEAELMYITIIKMIGANEFVVDNTYFEFMGILGKINRFLLAADHAEKITKSHPFTVH